MNSYEAKIRVAEIVKTIHGELPGQGMPCLIIRLAGCETGCVWCDTGRWKDLSSGRIMTVRDLVGMARSCGLREVLVTGGEPLAQKSAPMLIRALIGAGFSVTVETDGTHSLKKLPGKTLIVMDLKPPSSKTKRKPLFSEIGSLKRIDVLKIPVCTANDYLWGMKILKKYRSQIKCMVVFSPVYGKISPSKLAGMLIRDNSPYRMQIQLHKLLGMK